MATYTRLSSLISLVVAFVAPVDSIADTFADFRAILPAVLFPAAPIAVSPRLNTGDGKIDKIHSRYQR